MKKLIVLVALLMASSAFAQKTTDWRPINRIYKNDGVTLSTIVSSVKAGHIVTSKSFPVSVIGNDKLAFWNMTNANDSSSESSCAGGTAACNLTSSGVLFSGTNLFGGASIANMIGGYFTPTTATDAFYNPGDVDFSYGGWFSVTGSGGWNNSSSNQTLIGNYSSASDMGWKITVYPSAYLGLFVPLTSSTYTALYFAIPTWSISSWHHVAATYSSASKIWTLYVDGAAVGTLTQANKSVGTSAFHIGAAGTTPGETLVGQAQEVFYAKAMFTAHDIRKLYSTRIDHNKNLIAKRQDWYFKHQHLGTAGNPYQSLPFMWYDPTDSNSLFVDFSDLDATDKIDIRLYDLQQ